MKDLLREVTLSARLLAGRRYWILFFVPLLGPLLQAGFRGLAVLTGGNASSFGPRSAQGVLIGLPMAVLAIFLGVRTIAGEADARRLEIAYTVPGGSYRVWRGKLLASLVLLLGAEVLLAVVAWIFFTPFPPSALYGALQPAVVYLVLAMGLAVLFKSEVTGAMVTAAVLIANGFFTGFGGLQTRLSPFFNPLAVRDADAAQLFAWTLQNRIGFALAAAALTALAFARAERREKMLGG